MQGLQIDWNPFTMMNTIYTVINVIPLLIVSIIVYRRDPTSKINRLYSISSALLAFAFSLFPIGGLFWDYSILGIQVILISTRLVFFIGFISQSVSCWVSLALYDGEAMWSRTRTTLFLGGLILINFLAVLTPDAIYIIHGPPEVDTGEGLIYGIIGYPQIAILLTITFFTFLKTYVEFHEEDRIIGRQAMILTIGSSLAFAAMVTGLLSLILLAHSLTVLIFAVSSAATIVKSFGFTQEASMMKLKITSELRRLKIAIAKGEIDHADVQLDYIKNLVAQENLSVATARMMTLEALVKTYQSDIPSAYSVFSEARRIAENEKLTSLLGEIDTHLEHLQIYETALTIGDSIASVPPPIGESDELERALVYLDELITNADTIFGVN
ncbi:MAG: hypothetical protein RTV72_00040 [Candidatus Thorarchaeota archaeon]